MIQSTADPAVCAKKLTQVALRRAIMNRTVDQIFDSEEREEIEEEMQENDEIRHIVYAIYEVRTTKFVLRTIRQTPMSPFHRSKDYLNSYAAKWGLEIERVYIKDLLLPENIQQSIEETNEKKRMADINQQIDQKQAESKAKIRVSLR